MTEPPIPLNIAVEDDLSEIVVRVILKKIERPYYIGTCLKRNGKSYLQKIADGINRSAHSTPCLMLIDMNNDDCPPVLKKNG